MSQYRFYLNGQLLVDEVEGWEKFVTNFKLDDEFRGVFLGQQATLTFHGDGYTYLKNLFDGTDVCALVEFVVEYNCSGNNYEEMLRGTIFLTSLKFEGNEVKTVIHDNSFFAKIYNNKSIKAYVDVARSKNDVTITPAVPVVLLMFNPCTCLYIPTPGLPRRGWRIRDCFRYIISFMTDGDVGFVSDYFTTGIGKDHLIATGIKLRNPNNIEKDTIPFFSFIEIFTETNKKYNLGIVMETIAGVPTVRIEPQDYFRTQTNAITLADPTGVKMSTDISQLYAKIDIGSNETEQFQPCLTNPQNYFAAKFPEGVDYVGFKQETFPLLTKCNHDKTLNLVSDWVISSNVIQVVLASSDDYDGNIFFIETALSAGNYWAVQTDVFNDGNCYYNAFYNNLNTIQRWEGSLPASIIVILGTGDNTFRAFKIGNSALITLIPITFPTYTTTTQDGYVNFIEPFNDDFNFGFDVGTNYGTTVNPIVQVPQGTPVTTPESIYIVPASGNYQFEAGLTLKDVQSVHVPAFAPNELVITVRINRYSAAGVLIQAFSQITNSGFLPASPTLVDVFAECQPGIIALNINDYLSVTYEITGDFPHPSNWVRFKIAGIGQASNNTYFLCNFSQGFGGELTTIDSKNFPNLIFDFQYPLTYEHSQTLKADTKNFIQFNWCGKNYRAWIKNVDYHHHNSNSKLTLLTTKNEYLNNP